MFTEQEKAEEEQLENDLIGGRLEEDVVRNISFLKGTKETEIGSSPFPPAVTMEILYSIFCAYALFPFFAHRVSNS